MPLETRGKKRETIEASVEFAINESTEKTIKLNIPSGAGSVKSSMIDVSVSGCAIDSPYIIPPGVILDIKIDPAPFTAGTGVERKGPLNMTGKITSCVMKSQGHYRCGVFFTHIEKEDSDLIDNFIKQKERRKTPRWKMEK